MDPYAPLFTLLRQGREHCKVAIECEERTEGSSSTEQLPSVDATLARATSEGGSATSASAEATPTRRIFALVTNVESGYEQACLFVLQRRSNDPQRARIVDGLPILPGFKASVRQVPSPGVNADVTVATAAAAAVAATFGASTSSHTVPSSASAAATSSLLQLDMTLAGKTISAVSADTQAIRDLTTVLRQLTGLAEAHDWTPSAPVQQTGKPSHAWVEHYMHVERGDTASSSSPTHTPIFSRFTTSAFAKPSPPPVRPYARLRDRSPGPNEVKVSIGTFNVNGQVPDASTTAHLNDWLHAAEDEPDILVLGIEEADSSNLSYVVWTPHVEASWGQAVAKALAARRPEPHVKDDDEERHEHHSDDAYVKLTSKQLVGVLIMVYVRARLLSRIEDPAVASVGVGLGGWVANKGAAAVRMKIDNTSMCFVVSHLSAFSTPDAVKRRRWDFHEIVRRLTFVWLHDAREDSEATRREHAVEGAAATTSMTETTLAMLDAKDTAAMSKLRAQLARSSEMSTDDAKQTPAAQQATQQHSHHIRDSVNRHVRRALANEDDEPVIASDVDDGVGHRHASDEHDSASRSSFSSDDGDLELQRWKILDHDVVFWAGDLNWRVDLNIAEVKRLIGMHQYEDTLLKFDQLRGELSSKASFVGFQEQNITFAPTYKYDRGTDTFDTSEKQRCPAWTDRVLWYEKDVEAAPNGVYNVADKDHEPKNDERRRVQPLRYESAPSIRLSDHKPVLASFHVRTAGVDS